MPRKFYVLTKPYAVNLFGPRCIALGFNFSSKLGLFVSLLFTHFSETAKANVLKQL